MLNDNRLTDEYQTTESTSFMFDSWILLKVYLKKLKVILFITLLSLLVSAIWVKLQIKPIWKAHCYIIRAPKNMSTPVDMPYLYQTFDINTILETSRTRDVLTSVIDKLELDMQPEDLFKHIEVQRGNRSNVLRFSVIWPDPEKATEVANAAAESFIYNNTQLLNSATLKIYNYYLEQQKLRLENIKKLESQYAQHRAEYGVISIPHESEAKFEQLKELELRMIENRLHIKDLDSMIADMREKIDALPNEVMYSWIYAETDENKLLGLEKELEELRSRYTDENPKIQKVLAQIAELRQTMQSQKRDLPKSVTWGPSTLEETYTIEKSRYESEREGAIQKDLDYQAEIESMKGSLAQLSQLQKDFYDLERQLELNKDILKLVESRLAEAKMAMQSNVSDYEILEEAKVPQHPENGHRRLVVLAIGFLVFFALSVYVIIKELLDSRIKSAKDFSDFIKIPLIGILPDETQVPENVYYRNLQVLIDKILLLTNAIPRPVITWGSDIAETGKSFLIKDCMEMLNHQNKKILYIDTIKHSNSETQKYTINSLLYGDSTQFCVDDRNPLRHYAFFLADERVFSQILDKQKVNDFLDTLGAYDFIFWELAAHEYNLSLFTNIASATDLLISVARFKRSNRNSFAHLARYLEERGFHKIYGVLNYVPKDFFHEHF
ncbi:MAG: polysaccharide biosynthesis transport protein [Candidatus Cloacimonadota bacterium]|nr:polysaccharide biosynthesis transport protein [Candidatus Cloacimonadota bacterium]